MSHQPSKSNEDYAIAIVAKIDNAQCTNCSSTFLETIEQDIIKALDAKDETKDAERTNDINQVNAYYQGILNYLKGRDPQYVAKDIEIYLSENLADSIVQGAVDHLAMRIDEAVEEERERWVSAFGDNFSKSQQEVIKAAFQEGVDRTKASYKWALQNVLTPPEDNI